MFQKENQLQKTMSSSNVSTAFNPNFRLGMCEQALSKSKFDIFRDGVDRDINDAKKPGVSVRRDFLNIVPDNELDIFKFGIYDCSAFMPVKKAKSLFLSSAIRETYENFDPELYQSFSDPTCVIRNMIWGKFRKNFGDWCSGHSTRVFEENRKRDQEYHEMLRNASIKRQQKVDQEISRLGGVDRYNQRMIEQRRAADLAERETNLRQEKAFQDWLASSEAKMWTVPIPDSSVQNFFGSTFYSQSGVVFMYVNKTADFSRILRDLLANSHGKIMAVTCKLFWNSYEAYSYPAPYVVSGTNVMSLTGSAVLSVGMNIDVVGVHYDTINDKVYIVTKTTTTVFRSLPEPFAKTFRARNPSLKHTSTMRILRDAKAISEISVYHDNTVYKFVPRLGATYPDVASIFTPKSVRDVKTKTDIRIADLQKKEDQRIAEMKARGKSRTPNPDAKPFNPSPSVDEKARKLTELFNLLTAGVINEQEFTMLKNRI